MPPQDENDFMRPNLDKYAGIYSIKDSGVCCVATCPAQASAAYFEWLREVAGAKPPLFIEMSGVAMHPAFLSGIASNGLNRILDQIAEFRAMPDNT